MLGVGVGVLKSAASVLVLSRVIFVTPHMIGRLEIFSFHLRSCGGVECVRKVGTIVKQVTDHIVKPATHTTL